LWFLDELLRCSAKVLARAADGDLHFVGRSADSIFDLLGGALAATSWRDRLHQLPLSLRRDVQSLSRTEVAALRAHLAARGLSPTTLARARRPIVFVDLVYVGHTFCALFGIIRDWVADDGAQWGVVRTKLRFVGITERKKTSPRTWRWQQHAEWTRDLPSRAVVNISVPWALWDYFGNCQRKLTLSFHSGRWDESIGPQHDEQTRSALAEAVALVECGRTRETRDTLVRLIAQEPTIAQPWLRALAGELRR
jgi:hypothetical protein